MLSSCVINVDGDSFDFELHNFTLLNDTSDDVYDWYLKDNDGHNIAIKKDDNVFVRSGSKSKLRNVREGRYRVYLSYRLNKEQYYYSDSFYLGDDMEYSVMENSFFED